MATEPKPEVPAEAAAPAAEEQEQQADDAVAPGNTAEQRQKQQPAEEEGYDPSLLIMVKGKAKRPERPNDEERNIQVQKLQEQIDRATARIAEIKALLDARGNSRGAVSPEVQAGRDKIAQLRAEFDTVLVRVLRANARRLVGRGQQRRGSL